MAASLPSPSDGPETGFSDGGDEDAPRRGESKRKRFHPFRAVRNIFRRAKRHGPDEETVTSKKSRSTSELSSVQAPPDTPTFPGLAPPYAAGLSVSHDSIFSPDQQLILDSSDQQAGSARSMQHVRLKGFKDELFTRVRARRDSDEDEDAGLPSSPCTSPTTADVLSQGLQDKPSHSRSTCSAGSLISMGSSENDEDSGGFMSSSHSSRMSLLDRRPFDLDVDGDAGPPAPLNHNAARHKMSVRPKRTHSIPRHRKIQQMAAAAVAPTLPSTPEVFEDYTLKFPTEESQNPTEFPSVQQEQPSAARTTSQEKEEHSPQHEFPVTEELSNVDTLVVFEESSEERISSSLIDFEAEVIWPETVATEIANQQEDDKKVDVPQRSASPTPQFSQTPQVSSEESNRPQSPDRPPIKVKGKSNAAELKLRHEIKQYSKRQKEQKEIAMSSDGSEVNDVKEYSNASSMEDEKIDIKENYGMEITKETETTFQVRKEERFKSTIMVTDSTCTLQSTGTHYVSDDKSSQHSMMESNEGASRVMAEIVQMEENPFFYAGNSTFTPLFDNANLAPIRHENRSELLASQEITSDSFGRMQETRHGGNATEKVAKNSEVKLNNEIDFNRKETATKSSEAIAISKVTLFNKEMTQKTDETNVEMRVNRHETSGTDKLTTKSNIVDTTTTNFAQKESDNVLLKSESNASTFPFIDNTNNPEIDSSSSGASKESRVNVDSPAVFSSGEFEDIMKQRRSMTQLEDIKESRSIRRATSEDVTNKSSSKQSNQRFSVEIVPFNTRNKDPNYLPTPTKSPEELFSGEKKEADVVKAEFEYPPVELRRKHSFTTTARLLDSDIPIIAPSLGLLEDNISDQSTSSSGNQIKYPVQFRIRRGKSMNEKSVAGQGSCKEVLPDLPRPKSQILLKDSIPNSTVPEFMKIQLRSSREELDIEKGEQSKNGACTTPVTNSTPVGTPQWEVKIGQSKSQPIANNGTVSPSVDAKQGETCPSVAKMAIAKEEKISSKEERAEEKDRKDSENKENIGCSNVLVKDEGDIGGAELGTTDDNGKTPRSGAVKDDGRRKSQSFTGGVVAGDPEPELFRVFARRSIKQRSSTKNKGEDEKKTEKAAPTATSVSPSIGKEETTPLPPARAWRATSLKSEVKSTPTESKVKESTNEKVKLDSKRTSSPVETSLTTKTISNKAQEAKSLEEDSTVRSVRVNLERSRFAKTSTEPEKPLRRKSSAAGDLLDESRTKPIQTQQPVKSVQPQQQAVKPTPTQQQAVVKTNQVQQQVTKPVQAQQQPAKVAQTQPASAKPVQAQQQPAKVAQTQLPSTKPIQTQQQAGKVAQTQQLPAKTAQIQQQQAVKVTPQPQPQLVKPVQQLQPSKPSQPARVTVSIKPQAEIQLAPPPRKTSLPESPNLAKNGQSEMDPFGGNNNHIPGTPTWMQLAQQRREQREQKERMLYGSSANSFVLDTSSGSKPSRNSKVLDLVNNFQKLQTT